MSCTADKRIIELCELGKKFTIPAYQRGYRWGKINVKQMIQDMFEQVTDKESSYSLQPLTVLEFEDAFNVIDGQQRLTTILIVIAVLRYLLKKTSSNDLNRHCFSLEYETRAGSKKFLDYLLSLSQHGIEFNSEDAWGKIWKGFIYDKDNRDIKENLDFRYMVQAIVIAKENLEKISDRVSYEDMYSYLYNNCKFIWYPLESKGIMEEKQFYKVNMGQIPLSNSELIKSEFMKPQKSEDDSSYILRTTLLTDSWYQIEIELRNPDFWAFIPHKNQYGSWNNEKKTLEERPTCFPRIDEILQLILLKKKPECEEKMKIEGYDKFFMFNQLSEWILTDNSWMEIEELFSGIKELYNADGRTTAYQDYYKQNIEKSNKIYREDTLYNLLGYIIYTYSIIVEKSECFLGNFILSLLAKDRKYRRCHLKTEIKKILCEILKIKINEFNIESLKNGLNLVSYEEDIKESTENFSERKDKNKVIKSILLLFNMILLDNNPGISNRYDFLQYKYWSVEHIFSKNEKLLTDDDAMILKLENELFKLKKDLKTYEENLQATNEKHLSKLLPEKILEIKEKLGIEKERKIKHKENEIKKKEEENKKEIEKLFDSEKMFVIRKDIMDSVVESFDNKDNLSPTNGDRVKLIFKLITHIELLSNDDKRIEWEKLIEDRIIEKYRNDVFELMLEEKDANSSIDNIFSEWEEKKSSINEFITKIQYIFGLEELILYKGLFHENRNEHLQDVSEKVQTQNEVAVLQSKEVKSDIIKNAIIEKFKMLDSPINKTILNKIYSKEVEQYFKEEHNELLKEDSLKNLALLRSVENRAIANTFLNKKEKIHNYISNGTVIPYSTLLVFTDRYTNLYKLSNAEKLQWLPSSSDKYFKDILDTIINFMEE